jgi:hypothetical protein
MTTKTSLDVAMALLEGEAGDVGALFLLQLAATAAD